MTFLIKVLIAKNGFILILYKANEPIEHWIAKDAYDLSKVVGLIENYISPEPQEEEEA